MAVISLALIAFGNMTAIVVVLLGLWGMTGTAAPVGWWAWVAKTFPSDAEAGGGLLVAVVQMAIALGSTMGGLLFDTNGYQSTFVASAALLMLSAVLTVISSRMDATRTD